MHVKFTNQNLKLFKILKVVLKGDIVNSQIMYFSILFTVNKLYCFDYEF